MPFDRPETTEVETRKLRELLTRSDRALGWVGDAFKVTPDYSPEAVAARIPALNEIERVKKLAENILGLDKPRYEAMD